MAIEEQNLESLVHNGINVILKRDNKTLQEFEEGKIAKAIFKAAKKLGGDDYSIAQQLARKIHNKLPELKKNDLYHHSGKSIPGVNDIQNAVIKVLREENFDGTAASYEFYMKQREKVRKNLLKVKANSVEGDTTDQALLLVDSLAKAQVESWDRSRIELALVDETDLDLETAREVSKSVENIVLLGDYDEISTDFIRSLANAELAKRGLKKELEKEEILGMSVYDLEKLLYNKSNENSNVATNNPEAINLAIAENTLRRWALKKVFSKPVSEAYFNGMIHLHDLGMSSRVYCSSHSLEYIKKYGLELENLQSSSSPASHSATLTGHTNTFIASMQAYYAGALGIAYVNLAYGPYLDADIKERGLTGEKRKKFLKQGAQEIIFNGAQNAFSRGAQTVFLDFNLHLGVPNYLWDVPTIGPGGKYMFRDHEGNILKLKEIEKDYGLKDLVLEEDGRTVFTESIKEQKVSGGVQRIIEQKQINLKEGERVLTFGDFEEVSQDFAEVMLEVWEEGDKEGRPFPFPKCDLHIDEQSFIVKREMELLKRACKLASKNGSTYFIFDRDEATLSACCRLRTTLEDDLMIKHPESMRFCGFQNVTINLPQASYRAGKNNLEGLVSEIDAMMELAATAHLEKKKAIGMMQTLGGPQWQTGKLAKDGKAYIDLDKCTYIIGLIGLNEAIQYQLGKELHELSEDEFKEWPISVISHMKIKAGELSKKYNLSFKLEESPAESTTRRFSKIDLVKYKEAAESVVKGSIENDETYYTNSIHLRADASVDLPTRIDIQSRFHTAIDSGAIIHAFVGENLPSEESIYNLVKKTYEKTQAAQLTISPEFTFCKECKHIVAGLKDNCPECNSENLDHATKIVGYLSIISNWNKSKLGELKDRQAGNQNGAYALDGSLTGSPLEDYYLRAKDGKTEAIVFGKEGCDKCKSLIKRIDTFMPSLDNNVKLIYHDLLKEEGFAESMWYGINPSRIPTLVIQDKDGVIAKIETDYSNPKKSVIKEEDFAPYLVGK